MATQSEIFSVGKKLVEFCKNGENLKAINQLYSDRIESHEAISMPVRRDFELNERSSRFL